MTRRTTASLRMELTDRISALQYEASIVMETIMQGSVDAEELNYTYNYLLGRVKQLQAELKGLA